MPLSSPHAKSGELCSTSFWAEYLQKYLEISCTEDLSLLHLLIYLTIFLPICTHAYLFYILTYTPIPLYMFCCSNCYIGLWVLIHLAPVLLWHLPPTPNNVWVFVFVFLSTSFISDTRRCSRLIFYNFSHFFKIHTYTVDPWTMRTII